MKSCSIEVNRCSLYTSSSVDWIQRRNIATRLQLSVSWIENYRRISIFRNIEVCVSVDRIEFIKAACDNGTTVSIRKTQSWKRSSCGCWYTKSDILNLNRKIHRILPDSDTINLLLLRTEKKCYQKPLSRSRIIAGNGKQNKNSSVPALVKSSQSTLLLT